MSKIHTYTITAFSKASGQQVASTTVDGYVHIALAKEFMKKEHGSGIKFSVQDITKPAKVGKKMQSRLDSLFIEK